MAVGRQCHQGLVPCIRSQHHRADEAGSEQVGEHQLSNQHVEQGDGIPAPRVTPPAARQQCERDEVPQHPGREHHGADGWAFAGREPLSSLAVLPPGAIGPIAHGGVPGGEMCPPLPACTWEEEDLSGSVPRPRRKRRGGIETRAPFWSPARTEGRLVPGLPQLPEWRLGCSIWEALEAPPTRAHHAWRKLQPSPRRRPGAC